MSPWGCRITQQYAQITEQADMSHNQQPDEGCHYHDAQRPTPQAVGQQQGIDTAAGA